MKNLWRLSRKIIDIKQNAIYFLCLLLNPFCCIPNAWCQTDTPFNQVMIQPDFETFIKTNTVFMAEGGARLIESEDGCKAIVGIDRSHQSIGEIENYQQMVRKGAIKARAVIVELIFGVEVESKQRTVSRHQEGEVTKDPSSIFRSLQEIKSISKVEIDLLPVVGTWQSSDGRYIYTAVGKRLQSCEETSVSHVVSAIDPMKDVAVREAKEPFLSLLRTSPLLCRYGGVKCFEINGLKKVVVAVGYASIKGSTVNALKIARLKAVRALLANNEGIKVIHVQWTQDQERLEIVNSSEQYMQLSRLWSLEKERIVGKINSLPIVVVWNDKNHNNIFVAIGN